MISMLIAMPTMLGARSRMSALRPMPARRCMPTTWRSVFARRGMSALHRPLRPSSGRCRAAALRVMRCGMRLARSMLIRHGARPRRRTGMRPRRSAHPRASRRPHVGRHLAMRPRIALRIPRTPTVVGTPVCVQREGDDRQAQPGSVGVERHPAALIDEGDAAGVEPAPVVLERDVTPAPVVQATVHVERRAGVQLRNHRILPVRSRAQIHGMSGIGVLRAREAACRKQQRSKRPGETASVHGQASD